VSTTETPASDPDRPTPPWRFLFLDLQFGAAVGYLSIVVPYWMRQRGYDLPAIAAVTAGANLAHAFKITWVPLLDLGAYRKVWYLAAASCTAAVLLAIAFLPDPLANLPLFAALLTLLQATAATGHSANNTLMATTTRRADKGRVGGFAQASNMAGTSLLAAVAIVLAERVSARVAAVALAGVVVASSAMALRIVERREPVGSGAAGGALAAVAQRALGIVRDLGRTARSRDALTGIAISLLPVGAQAMSNLFAGVYGDYGASADMVALANGLGGGIAGGAGALVGGALADRMGRRLAYGTAGSLLAASALAMAAAPLTPATYLVGTFAYLFAGGMCFAAWTGMVLELVGPSTAAATKYALFNASFNLCISYMIVLDGRGGTALARALGLAPARGALLADAGLTLLAIGALAAMGALFRRRPAGASASAPGT
jgi:MFS family permease